MRRSLAVELRIPSPGGAKTLFLVANHWSSKYEDDRDYGARQPPVKGTGALRLAQARALRSWVDEILKLDPNAAVLVAGDLNDLEWTEPIRTMAAPPLVDLGDRIPAPERYSYVFEGIAQVLDSAIASPALAAAATLDYVHLNADCPDSLRLSDHDPLVVEVRVAALR